MPDLKPLQWEVWEFHNNVRPVRTAYINAVTYDEAREAAATWGLPVRRYDGLHGTVKVPCVVLCVVNSQVSDTFHAWPQVAPPAAMETLSWLERIKDHRTRRMKKQTED